MAEYQCEECGGEITGPKPWRRTYCSKACTNHSKKKELDTSTCPNCGDTFDHRPCVEREYCSTGCYNQENHSGSDNQNYIDGRSETRSYGPNWKTQRRAALERDFYHCRVCNISGEKSKLHVHHRTPIRNFDDKKKANRLRNLLTVCPRCHGHLEQEIE